MRGPPLRVARPHAVEDRRAVRNGPVTESLRGGTTVRGYITPGRCCRPFYFNRLCNLAPKSRASRGRFDVESSLRIKEMAEDTGMRHYAI